MAQHVLGIDIGGSGIKGALVDLTKGEFASDRLRIPTPGESTPQNVAGVVKQIVEHFGGRLWLESVPGEGATFSFELPLKSAAGEG